MKKNHILYLVMLAMAINLSACGDDEPTKKNRLSTILMGF